MLSNEVTNALDDIIEMTKGMSMENLIYDMVDKYNSVVLYLAVETSVGHMTADEAEAALTQISHDFANSVSVAAEAANYDRVQALLAQNADLTGEVEDLTQKVEDLEEQEEGLKDLTDAYLNDVEVAVDRLRTAVGW